ncbi:dynein regulatory complex subunit 4 [Teleopsis dalmanni]|uniref:dynein regulatory complex subunit 4 n=1 Tax=Teleopsis dalmanni TaxID=139649 RepID=UPI0018CDA344|nr:dynein regulatory complex subunit 4 [Teleopsis dalmanni]
MPPKKKGKGKGKGKKGPILIDGVDTSKMDRNDLEAFALRLKAELDREREERNYFQLERDKIRTFWEITRGHLDETYTELREKDREIEMANELAERETKHALQQMKHLQYESQNKIGEVRAEAMTQLKLAQEEHAKQEMELLKDKREFERFLRERDELHELQIQQLKVAHISDAAERKLDFQREAKDLNLLHEQKMQQLKRDLELSYEVQMSEVQERKNTQLARLIESHEIAFNDMKNYYNDITLNNLGLISSLKEQMETLRKQAERSERVTSETLTENRKLKEPLEEARAELSILRRKLEHFNRNASHLKRLQVRNEQIEKDLTSINWENEALLMRNETLVKEREELKLRFNDVVTELQQKTGLNNVLLERKISVLKRDAEKRDVMLRELVSKCTVNGEVPPHLEETVSKMLDYKNKLIETMRYELTRTTKAHDDLLATYEAKLKEFGIPKEELGFEPLQFTTKRKYLCGPAGLVTKNQ